LGLSTAYGIIRSHNGEVAVVSSSPKGTTFEIRLPLADSGVGDSIQNIVMGTGQAILIIDKKSENTTATGDLLECLGYRPERVPSVDDAIQRYASLRPEIILADVSELCEGEIKQLKAISDNDPSAKVVALMNIGDKYPADKSNGLEDIVKGTLYKPLDISEASQLFAEVLAC
jgi:CheY-like chemotaxis protein